MKMIDDITQNALAEITWSYTKFNDLDVNPNLKGKIKIFVLQNLELCN